MLPADRSESMSQLTLQKLATGQTLEGHATCMDDDSHGSCRLPSPCRVYHEMPSAEPWSLGLFKLLRARSPTSNAVESKVYNVERAYGSFQLQFLGQQVCKVWSFTSFVTCLQALACV